MTGKLVKIFTLDDIALAIDRDKTTIIKWEKLGKIPKARRDKRGWRYYSEKEANTLIQMAERITSRKVTGRRKKSTDSSNKIFGEMSEEKMLKYILSTPKMRRELIDKIIKDNKLQKVIIKLLVQNIAKK